MLEKAKQLLQTSCSAKVGMNVRYLCSMATEGIDSLNGLQPDSVQLNASDSGLSIAESIPQVSESLFVGHELQPKDMLQPIDRVTSNNDSVFGILMLCGAAILYLQRNSDNLFRDVIGASFDMNQALQDARVENSQRARNLFILQLLGFVCMAFFLAGSLIQLEILNSNWLSIFFSVLGILIGFVLVKKLIVRLLALLFELHMEYKAFVFNMNILQSVSGLFLLPISLFLYYAPIGNAVWPIWLGLSIMGFFYLKALQRGFTISLRSSGISTLHLFYYLCALEILPAFILVKWVLSTQ